MTDPRTDLMPNKVEAFEFERMPSNDADRVIEIIRAGSLAQHTDTARRYFIRYLQDGLDAYRKEMWP